MAGGDFYDEIERSAAWQWVLGMATAKREQEIKELQKALKPNGAGDRAATFRAGILDGLDWLVMLPGRERERAEQEVGLRKPDAGG